MCYSYVVLGAVAGSLLASAMLGWSRKRRPSVPSLDDGQEIPSVCRDFASDGWERASSPVGIVPGWTCRWWIHGVSGLCAVRAETLRCYAPANRTVVKEAVFSPDLIRQQPSAVRMMLDEERDAFLRREHQQSEAEAELLDYADE